MPEKITFEELLERFGDMATKAPAVMITTMYNQMAGFLGEKQIRQWGGDSVQVEESELEEPVWVEIAE